MAAPRETVPPALPPKMAALVVVLLTQAASAAPLYQSREATSQVPAPPPVAVPVLAGSQLKLVAAREGAATMPAARVRISA